MSKRGGAGAQTPQSGQSGLHLVWPRPSSSKTSEVAEALPDRPNRLLVEQMRAASNKGPGTEPDLKQLLELISRQYDRMDDERRGIVRSMQLMSDEAQALTREIREQTAIQLQAILDNIKDAVITVDDGGHIETFNPTGERLFGYTQTEVLGRTLDYVIPEAAKGGSAVEYLSRLAARLDDTHVDLAARETWGLKKDGTRFAAEIAISQAQMERRRMYIVCLRDATERWQSEQALRESENRYRALAEALREEKERAQVTLQSIGDGVVTTDKQGRVDYLNPVAESLTGWNTQEARGLPVSVILRLINEVSREPVENPVIRCLHEGRANKAADHTALLSRGGQEIGIQNSAAPIRDLDGKVIGAVMVFHDVSRERRLRRALSYQASHDALTGLINRREFEARIQEALASTRREGGANHVLLYVDLDQFKLVNDTCGHPAGDRLLKQITGLLQTRIRASDTLARLGGDEFGILISDCVPDQAMKIAETLRQSIRDFRFVWHDGVLNVGASIGLVEINAETESMASLMSAADVACYAAKDQGRDRVHVYQQGNAPERHREMQWVSRLTRACEEDRLVLYFQPIVPIGANTDTRPHYELVIRMLDESGKLVQPNEFIPAAERYNLMPAIDRWVVRHTLSRLAHLETDTCPPYTLSVNLSGTSLNDDRFLEFLLNELAAYSLSPGAICFEITETAAIANLANVVYFMKELKSRGCRFSLDDFGSGLSSFMYLKTLPVDYLKIDGQFIENVTRDPIDRSMVEAISQIGRATGIQTIAERVESLEVLTELAQLGVGYAQGFHIAAPDSVERFPFLRQPLAAGKPA